MDLRSANRQRKRTGRATLSWGPTRPKGEERRARLGRSLAVKHPAPKKTRRTERAIDQNEPELREDDFNPDNPYIQVCDRPKITALQQQFPEVFVEYEPKKHSQR